MSAKRFAPLDGVRVVDVTTSIAGPYCTYILGLLGADVVKVERPGAGDDTRSWGPPFWAGESPTYLAMNSEKRSLAVDLQTPEGIEIVHGLVEQADVFVENLRPGSAERRGLGFDDLKAINERIVYCSIGAFGRRGPLHDRPGYDPLMQAATGIMSVTGEPDRPPVRAGVSLVDQGTGLWSTIGILAALRARDEGAGAQRIDTSLYEVALNWLPYQVVGYVGTGALPPRHGSGVGIIAPYETFDTRDGRIMIAAANDRLFARLCAALDLDELAADPRYATNASRVEHRVELAATLAERLAAMTAAEAGERLTEGNVPFAPVATIADAVAHEQTVALGLLQALDHDLVEDLVVVAPPLSVDGERLRIDRPAPQLGADTAPVLRGLGFGDDEIARLRDAGVVDGVERD